MCICPYIPNYAQVVAAIAQERLLWPFRPQRFFSTSECLHSVIMGWPGHARCGTIRPRASTGLRRLASSALQAARLDQLHARHRYRGACRHSVGGSGFSARLHGAFVFLHLGCPSPSLWQGARLAATGCRDLGVHRQASSCEIEATRKAREM